MPPGEEGNPVDRAAVRHFRVLCAEDHDQVAELIRIILMRAGYEVECAADGAEALQKINAATVPYDIVITDHVMPEMDGLQLVRALREKGFSGTVIVQSARLSAKERSEYCTLGVTRFIEKPVRPETLRALLNGIPSSARH
jgi:DNA-binding response OmpR family regulator